MATPERILFVEDDEMVALIVTGYLQDAGFEVQRSGSITEALALTDLDFDVALLDVFLPTQPATTTARSYAPAAAARSSSPAAWTTAPRS